MSHRKRRGTKQRPSMLPCPAVPVCCLVSFHFQWAIHPISALYISFSIIKYGFSSRALPWKRCGIAYFRSKLGTVMTLLRVTNAGGPNRTEPPMAGYVAFGLVVHDRQQQQHLEISFLRRLPSICFDSPLSSFTSAASSHICRDLI